MNPIETSGSDIEAVWDSFGINRCNFRPHWNGDLVNLFSVVEMRENESATEEFIHDLKAMAEGHTEVSRWR